MARTDLKLEECGTLPKPGPIGRLVRLVFGIACVWYSIGLWSVRADLISDTGIRSLIWNGILPGLFLISYVINIGYSRAWGKRPAMVSTAIILIVAAYGFFTSGDLETYALARVIWGWELYLFAHLGGAFLIAGVIGTPGCEMRAFHDLFTRMSGIATKEHYCPVGPLHPIDQWEASRKKGLDKQAD